MKINGLAIENTFAEAFNMKASRIIVTADNNCKDTTYKNIFVVYKIV